MSERVPEDWKLLQLGDVANISSGGTPSRSNPANYIGEIPWVKSGEVNQRKVSFTQEKISEQALKSSSAKWVKSGSVLVAMYGATAGKVAKLLIDATINQAIAAVCSYKEEAANDFLFHAIEFNAARLLDTVQGSGQPNLSGQLVKELKVPIPPLPEQKKIASILTSVDEVIETTQKQIDKLQDLKKATMNELLTKGIGHTEFKDSELGRIPKSWEVGRFDDFITLQRGHDLPVQERLDGEIPIYGSNGIVGYHISTSICEGGVITGRSGTIGDVHFEEGEYWALNTTLYVKAFHKNDKKFVFYFLNHFNLEQFSTGTGVPTLNRNDVHLQTVTFPDLVEQIQIRNILDKIEVYLNKKKLKLSQTQSLKKSLMQDLLTGKVRVQVN